MKFIYIYILRILNLIIDFVINLFNEMLITCVRILLPYIVYTFLLVNNYIVYNDFISQVIPNSTMDEW